MGELYNNYTILVFLSVRVIYLFVRSHGREPRGTRKTIRRFRVQINCRDHKTTPKWCLEFANKQNEVRNVCTERGKLTTTQASIFDEKLYLKCSRTNDVIIKADHLKKRLSN